MTPNIQFNTKQEELVNTLNSVCKKIAPLWSLESFVAVNPFLGFTDKSFEGAAKELAIAGGIQMTLPTSFYLHKLKEGELKKEDLAFVLNKKEYKGGITAFMNDLENDENNAEENHTITTISDIASVVTNKDWNRFMVSQISNWAASYFDKGQAIWNMSGKEGGIFMNWKTDAEIDFSPELMGLKNFRKLVKKLSNNPIEAIEDCLTKIDIPAKNQSYYLHRLLMRIGGWSAYVRKLDWDKAMNGEQEGELIEFLAILVVWEACLMEGLENPKLYKNWKEAKNVFYQRDTYKQLNKKLTQNLILQEAFDVSMQHKIVKQFESNKTTTNPQKIKAQAVFCIDVRSEVFRRNLEQQDESIETFGFAGFFGFPVKYVPLASMIGEDQCPVLLKPGITVHEEMQDEQSNENAFNSRVFNKQFNQVWKSFKSGAVTCFSFVSPVGLSYILKLFTDSFGYTKPTPNPNEYGITPSLQKKKTVNVTPKKVGNETTGIALEQQIQLAKNALKGMSLAENLADFVLIVGHGSSMVNNPHATGYDCGACGGHSGEANAKVAAKVLNNPQVREGLTKEGINIPKSTIFLACLHDTTTDKISIYNEYEVPFEKMNELEEIKDSLAKAGKATRAERALRFEKSNKSNLDKAVIERSKDWSQIRPEWGLAGCSTFVVAPRHRTKDINLNGQSFLHSYDWKKDKDFSILELIMTAPMVVTSWINLQYYGSTVDNKNMGAGNKALHNVTAGLGVLEGYTGDLRVGLPFQAIHDGEKYQHEPTRLNVVIEAPIEEMNRILEKHPSVRDLCDNGWIYLLAMNEEGRVTQKYEGNYNWTKINAMAA